MIDGVLALVVQQHKQLGQLGEGVRVDVRNEVARQNTAPCE